MKTRRHPPRTAAGFTLAEVAIATGIAAGVLAILTMMMGALSRDVRRLKPYEAWRRPAFVGKTPASSSTGTQTSTTPPTPTNTLPDADLEPSKRPSEGTVPPDPDDPDAKDPNKPVETDDNNNSATP